MINLESYETDNDSNSNKQLQLNKSTTLELEQQRKDTNPRTVNQSKSVDISSINRVNIDNLDYELLSPNRLHLHQQFGMNTLLQDNKTKLIQPIDHNGYVRLQPNQYYTIIRNNTDLNTINKGNNEPQTQTQPQPQSQTDPHSLFNYNSTTVVSELIIAGGIRRSISSYSRSILAGLVSGLFVGFGTIIALSTSGGISPNIRSEMPGLSRILSATVFPSALILELTVGGGELFTGNIMFMIVTLLQQKTGFKQLIRNLILSFISNLSGCLLSVALFGYYSGLYTDEPYLSYIQSIATDKINFNFGIVLIRAIAANMCVCLAIVLSFISHSFVGRLLGIFIPIFLFVCAGFEHVIANMCFIPLGMLYGAQVSIIELIIDNLLPSTIGNLIGGILVSLIILSLHSWNFNSQSAGNGNNNLINLLKGLYWNYPIESNSINSQKSQSNLLMQQSINSIEDVAITVPDSITSRNRKTNT